MTEFTQTRAPAVAGQFYPAAPARLRAEVERYLAHGAVPAGAARVRALIVPHAGYRFSGPTAGQAFARLCDAAGDVKRAVVVAPSHRAFFSGISIGDYAGFATPLGEIPVDVAACRRLADSSRLIATRRDVHADEHSLEVQLPFVQVALPDAVLVPVVCGDMRVEQIRQLAKCLADDLWRDDTVWIISSDFTHYGYSFQYVPFRDDVPKRLEELDGGAIERIIARDCEGFLDYVAETGATICGRMPIAVLLAVLERLPGAVNLELVSYTTSGKLTHDYDHTVSYASIAVTAGTGAGEPESSPASGSEDSGLSIEEQRLLLRLARETIRTELSGGRAEEPPANELTPALLAPGACFVTLHAEGDLRGCIGSLEADEPLYRNVMRNASSAAFSDYRFHPLAADELERIDIDISVLTPARPIASLDEFVVGRHGIILEKGRHRAVFLPQVAPEQGWDRETTARHLARKAGLRAGGWRRGASFAVFEALVFGETECG